ncbi:MAG: cytochrome P450 [Betaproteobacteria bacterium]|nr:MAG: cytochrome P450 [Betaproteobacteria bacterium]
MTTSVPDLGRNELYEEAIPYELFARLRQESPLWIEEPAAPGFKGGPGYWAVLRHADVQIVSRHPEIYSSWLGGTELRERPPQVLEILRQQMLNTDPPQHSKMRRIVSRAFTPQVISQLRASIEAHVDEVIDAVADKGAIDLVAEVSSEVPLLVLADILGVPAEDRHLLHSWTDRMVDPAVQADREAARALMMEMIGYATAKTAEKRAAPANDVWSLIVNAEVDGEQLTRTQLNTFFQLLMVAGNETTRNLISHGTLALSEHPEQWARLRNDISLLPSAIEEMLRYSPPVILFRRTATADTTLNGRSIRKGDKVVIFYASANRDEAAFTDPNRFDITRNPNPHISFGDGTHFCLGANLARLEARIVFTELFKRLPDLRVTGPAKRLASSFLNGLISLPVAFTPTVKKARQAERVARAPAAPSADATAPAARAPAARAARHATPLLVLFGSNFGTSEDIARHIGSDADGYGFATTVASLDDYAGRLPTEGAVVICVATYNGAPPDNAAGFLKWLDRSESLAGVNFSVFGCGNRDWAATFQEIPRHIDDKLTQRGARRIHPRGEGDASDDFDGQFQAWYKPLWSSLAKALSVDLEAPAVRGPMFGIEIVPGERMSPFVASLDARPMRVVVNRELRSRGESDAVAGSTRHIELELPDGVAYRAGDHLGVIPHNSEQLVRRVASRFGFERDVFVRLHARDDRKTFLPVGERVSLYTLLSDYAELQAVAARSHIQTLAAHAESLLAKTRLEALAAEDGTGSTLYRDDVLAKRKSVIDLLEEFPAVNLPLEVYLEMLTPLSPRYYSISSSPLVAKGRCSVTIGVVNAPARRGVGSFAGVCSNYLQHQAQESVLYAFVKDTKSPFQLPSDPSTPIIMIGPGTGLAPFRGFLQERAALKASGVKVGPSMLFFGCRHARQDFIYENELKEFVQQGVTELHVAFSRMQDEKIYVQDHLRKMSERINALIADGAVIYVCGDASRMEPAVRSALADILGESLKVDAAEANRKLNELVAQNRYLVDVWATG